jgi:hypothetical protein
MKWLVDKIVDFRLWWFGVRIDWNVVSSVHVMKNSKRFHRNRGALMMRQDDLRKAYNRPFNWRDHD